MSETKTDLEPLYITQPFEDDGARLFTASRSEWQAGARIDGRPGEPGE